MLSTSAFNAFLKTLEEPPPFAIFILATTEKHKILPTILSRCQIFDFKRITNNDTVVHLQEIVAKEEINAEKAALQVIAQKSEGCMRDSLSILDKIVSFTNGEVTYQNTLEHLNILDHDYYFRLLETQMQQDMAGGMLLFDEINRKGFEGDLVLNGYAEFIRNLLVCKNAKAASLLDVVEGLQPTYIEVAGNVSAAYLVSALNILNEAEINYKMARNKRLHVELALIKLSFLQQAIDLTFDSKAGEVVKKKRVNGPIAYKVQHLQSLQVVNEGGSAKQPSATVVKTAPVKEARLYVQTSTGEPRVHEPATTTTEQVTIAQPLTPTHRAEQTITQTATGAIAPKTAGAKKSFLQNLRDKSASLCEEEEKAPVALDTENLQKAWNDFAALLKQQQKNSVVTVFNIAQLSIINHQHFSVTVSTSIQQKFLDVEKLNLLEFLKNQFCNPGIGFTIIVVEEKKEEVQEEVSLNSREKYNRLVENYPMIKELKDRLKMELDY
jgi:DNA polymerase-3 subunit gamma/tau